MVRRLFLMAMSIILIVITLVSLSACRKSDTELVTECLVKQLNLIKNGDSSTMASLKTTLSDSERFGIDANRFIVAWLEDFDYTIGDIQINDKSATAVVNLRTRQLTMARYNAELYLANLRTLPEYKDYTEEQWEQKYNEMLVTAMLQEPLQSVPVVFTLVYSGEKWVISPSSNQLLNALVGGTSE